MKDPVKLDTLIDGLREETRSLRLQLDRDSRAHAGRVRELEIELQDARDALRLARGRVVDALCEIDRVLSKTLAAPSPLGQPTAEPPGGFDGSFAPGGQPAYGSACREDCGHCGGCH